MVGAFEGRRFTVTAVPRSRPSSEPHAAGLAPMSTGFRFHDLRHHFASLLIASGLDVKTVQARMRHANAKTTLDVYGHMWPERDESSRAAVAAVYAERGETPAYPLRTGQPEEGQ